MRGRLLVALPIAVLLAGCGAPGSTLPRAAGATAGGVIPWIDVKPPVYHQGLAVPVSVRTCQAKDLVAIYGGATGPLSGQLTSTIDLVNLSATDCVVSGAPAVQLQSQNGPIALQQSPTPTPSPIAEVTMAAAGAVPDPLSGRGGEAWVEVQWPIDDAGNGVCSNPSVQAISMQMTLPGDSAPLEVEYFSAKGSPAVLLCPPQLGVGSFEPSMPLVASTLPPPGPVYFQATLSVPSTALVGHALNYQVTLKSVFGRPLTFPNGCPAYAQDLGGPGGWTLGKTWYVFNCQPMGPVIAPGASFTFAMVMQIPASAPIGNYSLAWGMAVGDSNNRGLSANFTVTAH